MKVHLEAIRLALRRPLATALGELVAREGFTVRLTDRSEEGAGESFPLPSFGTETFAECESALRSAAQGLAQVDAPSAVEEIDPILNRSGLSATPAARHGVEVALLDLLARRRGCPVRALLASRPAGHLEVNALLFGRSPDELVEEAGRCSEEGFSIVKLKVASGPAKADRARIDAIAKVDRVRLRLDANGGWSERTAIEVLSSLGQRVELCEQPVAPGAVSAWKAVARASSVPLAADESVAEERHRLLLIEAPDPLVKAVVLKPMVLGGLLRSLRIAALAAERGVASYVTTSLDGPLSQRAAIQLACALPLPWGAHGVGAHRLFEPELPGYVRVVSGGIQAPSAPGLGL